MTWQLPPEYIEGYLAACKKAATDDEAFKVFRREPHITTIIENGNEEIASLTMQRLYKHPILNRMHRFITSEEVGDPVLHNGISPTTARYIYTTMILERLVGSISDYHIFEIGGGYGGLAKIIHDYQHPDTYAIFDLPEVQLLQERFLKEFKIKAYYPAKTTNHPCSLLIAWCSWSELDLETRKSYLPMIASARHILFCCNYNYAEDLELIRSVHPDVKEYSDNLYTNIIYK